MGEALPLDKFTDHGSRDDHRGGTGVYSAVRGTAALGTTTGLILVIGIERSTATLRLRTLNITSSVS